MSEAPIKTRVDLEKYIGQPESLRLEFTKSKTLSEPIERAKTELTKMVTAFANTEGGVIIIGMAENRKGKLNIAEGFDDGVSLRDWSPSKLQSIIEGNISPALPGLRVFPIKLDEKSDRALYMIEVPQGSTCYQAKDFKYYGRSEYESKPLRDHEIRLRMFRGTKPNAKIILSGFRKKQNNNEDLQQFNFSLALNNIGEINITEYKIKLNFDSANTIRLKDHSIYKRDGEIHNDPFNSQISSQDKVCIFPQDSHYVYDDGFAIKSDGRLEANVLILNWTLFLSNIYPINGQLNIVEKSRNWLT